MKLRFVLVCILFWGRPAAAGAQSGNSTFEGELIQNLAARIEQLERRVAELEGSKAAISAAVPATEPKITPQSTPDTLHTNVQAPAPAAETPETYPALKLAGFSDFNFGATDQRGTRSGFTEGQFVLHVNSTLSPKVSFLGELSLTARPDAVAGIPAVT